MSVLLTILMLFLLFPLQAYAEVPRISVDVNEEMVQMREAIASIEVITDDDLLWIEKEYGAIEIDNSLEEFSVITIRPYRPETIETRSYETIEIYRAIGLLVEKDVSGGPGGRGGYLWGGSGVVYAYSDIGVSQAWAPGAYTIFSKVIDARTTLINFYEYQRYNLELYLRMSGVGLNTYNEVISYAYGYPCGVYANSDYWYYPSLNTPYIVYSPSSIYWRTSDGMALIYLTNYFSYTRYNGGPVHHCQWTFYF